MAEHILSIQGKDELDPHIFEGIRGVTRIRQAEGKLLVYFSQDTDAERISASMAQTASGSMNIQSLQPAKELRLALQGLHCADCASRITQSAKGLDGVLDARVELADGKLHLVIHKDMDEDRAARQVAAMLKKTALDITLANAGAPGRRSALSRFILPGAGLALAIAAALVPMQEGLSIGLFLTAYLLLGYPVLWGVIGNIKQGQIFDENMLMTLATVGALCLGDFLEALAVMVFFRVGEAFQQAAVGRSRRSIAALMDIRPEFARVQGADGQCQEVSPEQVQPGDILRVLPGERIALDAAVLTGQAMLDTSALTGESAPRSVFPGEQVFAGSINLDGVLELKVEQGYGQSAVARILEMVERASERKAPAESFMTRFARYYTPAVVAAALVVGLLIPLIIGDEVLPWVNRALVFLVISCPCALVISIPLGYFGGIGGATRQGILIKGGNYLEALARADAVALDKTGTLTSGQFALAGCIPAEGFAGDLLLETAAQLEQHSTHPIAQSILRAYEGRLQPDALEDYREISGQGVRADVHGVKAAAGNARLMETMGVALPDGPASLTTVYIAIDGQYAGRLEVADPLKPNSRQAIQTLREMGIGQIALLTGDQRAVGEQVARELGLDMAYCQLLPDQKVNCLEQMLQNSRQGVIFVGDGINDAPVLARASAGVAMGGLGSQAAIEAADVVLMTDQLQKLPQAIAIARKTRRVVRENMVLSLGIKAIIMAFGILGMASMWSAVFADVGVSLIATLNAMRAMTPPKG